MCDISLDTVNIDTIRTPLPCNWISSKSTKADSKCKELPENPQLFNEIPLGSGSFGSVSILTRDNIDFKGSNEEQIKYCNDINNKCVVKKRIEIENNQKDTSNEANILWILSQLPPKFNKFFPSIEGYMENIHSKLDNFDDDDDDDNNNDNDNNDNDNDNNEDDMYQGGGLLINGNVDIYQTYSGQNLYYFMKGNNMSFYEIVRLMATITQGLCVLHACQICHYDLKPQNIAIYDIEHINIIDFGASRFIQNENSYRILKNENTFFAELYEENNATNALYSGPELFNDSGIKKVLSDMWNIGSIFVEILTGIKVSILLIINNNNDIDNMSFEKIVQLHDTETIWNPIALLVSLSQYEKKGIMSVNVVVRKFLIKFFESRFFVSHYKGIENKHIPDFITDISSCFICLKKGMTIKNRISANQLFRSIKELLNQIPDSLDNLVDIHK